MKPILIKTNEAAKILNRSPRTLRGWSSTGDGPIQPVKIHKKRSILLWRLSDIEKLIGQKLDSYY